MCDVLSKIFCLYVYLCIVYDVENVKENAKRLYREEKPMNISKSTNKGKNKCVFSIFFLSFVQCDTQRSICSKNKKKVRFVVIWGQHTKNKKIC